MMATPAGLTRGPSFFGRSFAKTMDCRVKPGNDGKRPLPVGVPQAKSPRPPRAAALPPKSLVLPRKSAGGNAHDLLRVGDGGADHLRRAAVSFEDRKRALGGGHAGEVEQAVAGDVDQRLHPGNLRQDLHRLGNVDVGRAQELLPERDGKLVELVADGVAVVRKKRLARER